MTAVLTPSPYVTDLSAVTEDAASHGTTKCVMRSSNFLDDTFPLTAYAENPSSTRAASDQRSRYVIGCNFGDMK